jgi:proline iminopeptidase
MVQRPNQSGKLGGVDRCSELDRAKRDTFGGWHAIERSTLKVHRTMNNIPERFFAILVTSILVCFTSFPQTKTDSANNISIRNGEFTARINGLKLWYKVSGEGPVCIYPTPGWGPSSELYYLKSKPLGSMFTMVYLDTRGSGRSERPELSAYAMRNFVADIEELRRHLGVETVWLMGHSDGGLMILNYASEHGDRVDGMILVDTPVGNTSKDSGRTKRMELRKGEPWFDKAFQAFQKMPTSQQEFETYIHEILPFFFSSTANLDKNREVFEKVTLSFDATRGRGQSDQSSANLATFLPLMKIPTLIIVGNDDFICPPSAAEYLHREIPNSRLLVIENAGHFPWLEQPEQFFGGIRTFLPKLGYHKN